MAAESDRLKLVAPQLPRQRKQSSRHQFDMGHSNSVGHQYLSAKEYFRKSYFEAIDVIVSEIKDRFSQPGFEKYGHLEKSLLVPVDELLISNELVSSCAAYGLDVRRLANQLEMLRQLMPGGLSSVTEVTERFKLLHDETRSLLSEVEHLIILLLVVPASSAHAERSFSMLRRIKTYMRSTMTQARLNHVTIVHGYQDKVDNLDVDKLCRLFINNDYRRSVFGNGV